jgi:hypothetical protein
MVVNFKTRWISQGARKLIQIPTLKNTSKKKKFSILYNFIAKLNLIKSTSTNKLSIFQGSGTTNL